MRPGISSLYEPLPENPAEMGGFVMPPDDPKIEADIEPEIQPVSMPNAQTGAPQIDPRRAMFERIKADYEKRYGQETKNTEQNPMPSQEFQDSTEDRASNREFIASLNQIGANIGGGKSDAMQYAQGVSQRERSDLDRQMKLGQSARDDQRQAGVDILGLEAKGQDFERNDLKIKADQDDLDPNSPSSALYRQIASEFFGKPLPENATASVIKKQLPGIEKIAAAKESRAAREQEAQLRMTASSEEKNKDRQFRSDQSNQDRQLRRDLAERSADAKLARPDKGMSATEMKLFDRYNGEKAVTDFEKIETTLGQMEELSKNPNPAADQAAVVLFNRVLDPNSVVREAEFAITERGAGAIQQIEASYNKFKGTGRLTPDIRQNLLSAARILREESRKGYSRTRSKYEQFATQQGLDPSRIFPPNPGEYVDTRAPVKTQTAEDSEIIPVWKPQMTGGR